VKIFCIGLSRTGTQSLNKALCLLGYSALHYPGIVSYRLGKAYFEQEIIEQYDAFSDLTVAMFYKVLDETYADAKFILTIRDVDEWIKSCERLYHPNKVLNQWCDCFPPLNPFLLPVVGFLKGFRWKGLRVEKTQCPSVIKPLVRLKIFNTVTFDADKYRRAYSRHTKDVLTHFSAREGKLLVMDICSGDSWEKLCPFLNKPLRQEPFPAEDPWKEQLDARQKSSHSV